MKGQYFCCIAVNAVLGPPKSGPISFLLLSWFLSSNSKAWLEADCIPPLPQPLEYLPSAKCSIRVDTREAVCLRRGTGKVRSC